MSRHLNYAITAAGFWLGTLLPVAYLPVFLAGIDSAGAFLVLVGLLSVHALALIVGHEYPDSQP
ncbi:hypothetical protein [Natronorubrum daqingense]|uniref:Uncharacterized protein n=1 Tax=Natronorubrum daqingense TaxID=588898 RepID=A0A1N6ZU46_9EURY|nr:hypothetical protein [Natronorubrum daqingense]APX95248.1 hypothetical protein BB347_00745 [Natronorubrum daqingense]SIR30296.1 hypothetical protein SAMN05421809_0915 [Natronorubrum daqingense]